MVSGDEKFGPKMRDALSSNLKENWGFEELMGSLTTLRLAMIKLDPNNLASSRFSREDHNPAMVYRSSLLRLGALAAVSHRLGAHSFSIASQNTRYAFRAAMSTTESGRTEKWLNDAGILALNGKKELFELRQRYCPIRGQEELISSQITTTPLEDIPIICVAGTLGSGKTFFSIKVAATYGLEEMNQDKYVTIYVKPYDLDFFEIGNEDAEKLMAWIKNEMSSKCGSFDKLNMHVSLVLDGVPIPEGYLDKKVNLNRIVELLKEMAESVRLVVAGSGALGWDLNSGEEAIKVRIRDDGSVFRGMMGLG
jgi:hypothetical protein